MLLAHPIQDQWAILDKWMDDDSKGRCYILASMSDELQHMYENMYTAKDILTHLPELWGYHSRTVHEMHDR